MVTQHSIYRSPRSNTIPIHEFISSLSPSLVLSSRYALSWFRARPPPASPPQGEHTRLYGFMYQKWWVHLFVISSCFCFYRDFIYDRIAEPQICDEIGWCVLFAGARMYICTYVRSLVCSFAGPVRSFVRSYIRSFSSIISWNFYIYYNLRGWSRCCHPLHYHFVVRRVTRTASNDN